MVCVSIIYRSVHPVEAVGGDFPKRPCESEEGLVRILKMREHADKQRSPTGTLHTHTHFQHAIYNIKIQIID